MKQSDVSGGVVEIYEKTLADLPCLNTALVELLKLDPNDDEYFGKVESLAERDPTFAVRLIRLANSAAHSPSNKITTIQSAIIRIGTKQLDTLIATYSLSEIFKTTSKSDCDLWIHSVLIAVAARALAPSVKQFNINPEEAYLCGLLHDIGRFILFYNDSDMPTMIDEHEWDNPDTLLVAEREVSGMDHATLGQFACEQWELPEEVSRVIGKHHEYVYDATLQHDKKLWTMVRLIQMADSFSMLLMNYSEVIELPEDEFIAKIKERCIHETWPEPPVPADVLQQKAQTICVEAGRILRNLGICENMLCRPEYFVLFADNEDEEE